MVVDRSQESDLRRRAAWLLAMLAVVAVLFVVLLVFVLGNSSKPGGPSPNGLITQTAPESVSGSAHAGTGSTSTAPSATSTGPGASTSAGSGEPSIPSSSTCPTSATCALTGDPGNAIAAVNAYRTQHGQQPVTGTVTPAAQKCALGNGSACTGDYAESQVASLSGSAVVEQIRGLNNSMLKPGLKSFAVGWALVPGSKQYYFAFVAQS